MTTTEQTERSVLIVPETRMPAEIVALLETLTPELAELAERVEKASIQMEPVVKWIESAGPATDGVFDLIRDLTPYGTVEDLWRSLTSSGQAAMGESPQFADVPWFDRLFCSRDDEAVA